MDNRLDSFRPSTTGWMRGTLAGWGTILLGLAGIVAAAWRGGEFGPAPLALTALAVAIVAWKWLQNVSVTYELTEERLIVHRGIFIKSIDEIELYRVKDCRLDFTLISQWADMGTISITSSDETTRAGGLRLREIAKARQRRERLRTLVDTARQKRRVREIDMAHEDF